MRRTALALVLSALVVGPAYGWSTDGATGTGRGGAPPAVPNASKTQITTRSVSTTSFGTFAGGTGSAFSFGQLTVDSAGHTISSFASSSTSFNAPRPATVSSVPTAILAFPTGNVAVVSRSTVVSGGTLLAGSGASAILAAPGTSFTTIAATAQVSAAPAGSAPMTAGPATSLPLAFSSATIR